MTNTQSTRHHPLTFRITAAVLGGLVILGVGGVATAIATDHLVVLNDDGDLTAAVIDTQLPEIAIDDYKAAEARAEDLAGRTIMQTWPATDTDPARTQVINLDAGDTEGTQVPDAGYQTSLVAQYATATVSHAWGLPKTTIVKLLAPLAIALLTALVLPALRIRRRGQALALVTGSVFVLDQTSKFIGWRVIDSAIINDGGSAIMPSSDLMRSLSNFYTNSLTGGFLDVISVGLLGGGLWLLMRRPRSQSVMLGGLLVWAGWVSNWSDRIGMTMLTAPGTKRGVIDWIGSDPGHWNLADVAIASGGILVIASLIASRAHPSRRTQIIGGSVLAVVALLAAAGSLRVGPTDVTTCTPLDAQTIATPGIAGTTVAKVTLTTGGVTCSGTTATDTVGVITALDASGAVLGSGQVDKLGSMSISNTTLRLLPLTGATLIVSEPQANEDVDSMAGAFTDGTWTAVGDGKWLLVTGDLESHPNLKTLPGIVTSFLSPVAGA